MKVFRELEKSTRDNLLILFATGLLFWLSMTSLLPILPTYIKDIGGSTGDVGIVMGAFAIGLLMSRNWLGNLADKRSRKIVVLIGTIVVAIAPIGYLVVKSIPVLFCLRAFHGVSIAAFTTGYSALVVDLSPEKQRGELIGYMSLSVPIGMTIGPALSGFVQDYTLLFSFSAVAGCFAFLCAYQVKEKDISLEISGDAIAKGRSFRQLCLSQSLLIPGVILLLIGLLFGTLATFLPLFLRELIQELPVNNQSKFLNAGWFYTAAAIASFVVRIFVGKASDRIGRGIFISISIAFYGLSMIVLAHTNSSLLLIFAAILEGAGSGVLIPMMIALMSDRSYPTERGKVYAICNTGFDLGVAIAGPVLGSLSFILSYQTMFSLSSSLGFLALLIFMTRSNASLENSLKFALGLGKDRYVVEKI